MSVVDKINTLLEGKKPSLRARRFFTDTKLRKKFLDAFNKKGKANKKIFLKILDDKRDEMGDAKYARIIDGLLREVGLNPQTFENKPIIRSEEAIFDKAEKLYQEVKGIPFEELEE